MNTQAVREAVAAMAEAPTMAVMVPPMVLQTVEVEAEAAGGKPLVWPLH
jgi:hypothetical protein